MRKGNYIGIYLLFILTGLFCTAKSPAGNFRDIINSVAISTPDLAGEGKIPSVFNFNNKIENQIKCEQNNILKIKNESPGGNMNNYKIPNIIPSENCNINFSALIGNMQNEGSSSYSSKKFFEFDNTVTQLNDVDLPSDITFATFRSPAAITLTGNLTIANPFYMPLSEEISSFGYITLSNFSATALKETEGYLIDSHFGIVSNFTTASSFPEGNSSLGNLVIVNIYCVD